MSTEHRLLTAATLAALLLTLPGAGALARAASVTSRAKQALSALGYQHLSVSCTSRTRCAWRGQRGTLSCTGRIAASGEGLHRRLRVSGVRCNHPVTRPPVQFGFMTYSSSATVAAERQEGATVTRLFVNWYQVEPQAGVWDWSRIDQAYQLAVAAGLRPLLVANAAPCWAQASCNLLFGAPPDPAHDADWAAFISQLVRRYPLAIGVEVWNEPNLAGAFYPQADPARYTQLLEEAYKAIKSVNPAMPVISGGLAMNGAVGIAAGSYADQTFLTQMFADGALRWMDGLAVHIYPTVQRGANEVWDPAAVSQWLGQAESIAAAAGAPELPIWITEIGVSTATGAGAPLPVTPQQQATDLVTMIDTAQADPHVRAMFVFSLQDATSDPILDLLDSLTNAAFGWSPFQHGELEGFGAFTSNWVAKPAACAISAAWKGSLSC
jgi:hypothetical protein